jgi:hypothetical protein
MDPNFFSQTFFIECALKLFKSYRGAHRYQVLVNSLFVGALRLLLAHVRGLRTLNLLFQLDYGVIGYRQPDSSQLYKQELANR